MAVVSNNNGGLVERVRLEADKYGSGKVVSAYGEAVVWLTDGECGTMGMECPEGRFRAVLIVDLDDGKSLSIGWRDSPPVCTGLDRLAQMGWTRG